MSALLGIGFGSCFVIYAAQTATHYGADHLASIYPLVFLAYGLSGLVGPWIGGLVYDHTGSYAGGFALSILVLLVAIIGSILLLDIYKGLGSFVKKEA